MLPELRVPPKRKEKKIHPRKKEKAFRFGFHRKTLSGSPPTSPRRYQIDSPKTAMEFAFRSQPTVAAADDEENRRPRRFPDPPPPHGHGDPNTSGVDAALLRQELLLELHKGFMHQDMILRKLLETERVMGFTAGSHNPMPALPWSQDYWHCRTPSMPPWELPLRQPCPCCGGSSMVGRAPPVYPYVERLPSPAPSRQLQSASDTEKQQDCRSSGARTYPASSHVELGTSPSKWTPEEETLVPVAPNASVRSMDSGSIHEEVASTHQRTHDSWERKCGAHSCHGVQHMYDEGRNKKSEEREVAKFAKDDQSDEAMQLPYRYSLAGNENTGSYQQKRLEFSQPAPEQTRLSNDVEQHQSRSSGLRTHPFSGYVELCRSPSKQTPAEETLVPVAAKAGNNQMRSSSFCEEAASEGHQQVVVGIKVDVEGGRSMQPLHEIKNQCSEEGKAIDSAIKDCIKKPMQQRLQLKPTDQENTANSEQKSTELNEATLERTAGVKRKLTDLSSPIKKQKPLGQWSRTVCQTNPANQHRLDEHLADKRHHSNVAALQTSRSKSNSPEPNTKATPARRRSRAITTNAHRDGVPENTWTCTLCQAKCTTEWDYYSHLTGKRHQENVEARHTKLSRSYCAVCDVQCSSEKNLAAHLAGRRHREALQGRD